MAFLDGVTAANNQGVLEDVFELADIAGVVIIEKHFHSPFVDAVDNGTLGGADALEDVLDQQRQGALAILQGGQFQTLIENIMEQQTPSNVW